jgi:hypothetical protein
VIKLKLIFKIVERYFGEMEYFFSSLINIYFFVFVFNILLDYFVDIYFYFLKIKLLIIIMLIN